MFKRSRDVPEQVSAAGLGKWYSSLDEGSRVKLARYLGKTDTKSSVSFFVSVLNAALDDDNYTFAVFIGESALGEKMSDLQRFILTEHLIEAYIGCERYNDAKAASYRNLDLYPKVRTDFLSIHGSIPGKMSCRNRLIDILVGVECDYDTAEKLLDRFYEMGLISKEDLDFRRQSLKVHRLQRTFDGVYTYRVKKQ